MHHNGAVPTPDADTPAALARWLAGPGSAAAIEAAQEAMDSSPGDPVAASTRLRRAQPTLDPARASAALEQVQLRQLAQSRYGLDARGLILSRDGLEQATRPEVARYRADQLRSAGVRRVVDLTGGLGFDCAAFAASGLEVTAVERDEATAVLLAHNCPTVTVVHADATQAGVADALIGDLAPTDVVFVDPARRDTEAPRGANLRARPERDPSRWSPPWSWVQAITHPRVAAKVAPSFRAPSGWSAEWVSVHRTVVECAIYSWSILPTPRRATVWVDGEVVVIDADDEPNETRPHGPIDWMHELDPAILKAEAVGAVLRANPELWSFDEESTWHASADEADAVYLRSFAVIEELQGSTTSQRRQLDRLAVDGLTVKCKDAGVAPHAVLRELDRREGNDHVLVITRRSGRTVRILCQPAPRRSA